MADQKHLANIVRYGSTSFHRISRPFVAGEVHTLVHAVGIEMLLREALDEVLLWGMNLEACVDIITLVNNVTKKSTTAERRLLVDVFAVNECYQKAEMKEIGWIQQKENATYVLTEKDTVTESCEVERNKNESTTVRYGRMGGFLQGNSEEKSDSPRNWRLFECKTERIEYNLSYSLKNISALIISLPFCAFQQVAINNKPMWTSYLDSSQ